MPVVKMDEKGRIQLPREVRKAWRLKPKQALVIEIRDETVSVKKAGRFNPEEDPLLHDILINPARSKVKVTKALLRKLKDEAWTP